MSTRKRLRETPSTPRGTKKPQIVPSAVLEHAPGHENPRKRSPCRAARDFDRNRPCKERGRKESKMDKRQKRRAEYKSWKKGYYHLCTDGKKGTICHDEAEYVYLVNTISLLDLLFPVKVHFYEVMRSHVHLLLSGRGADCVAVFDYVKSRINKRLVADGHPPLPEDYDFKLIPVVDEDQMRNNGVYIARNASEVMNIRPGGYMFGSSMAFYSDVPRLFETVWAGDLPVRMLRKMFQTHVSIPPDRLIHPGLGMVLPHSFVDMGVLYKVFPTAKEFETRLVKDYEAFVEIADQIGEEISFSVEETKDIVKQELMIEGRKLSDLSNDDRCALAVRLHKKYRLDAVTLSQAVFLPARIISQALKSKKYKE